MTKKWIVRLSCIACLIACLGDPVALILFGNAYPEYNQLKNTISARGASASPVSNFVSAWWIVVGVLFILFGAGFRHGFKEGEKYVTLASLCIMLYGLGEGIGSGAFKADHIGNSLTTLAIVHDTLGAFGVASIMILPLIMKRIILKAEMQWFHKMSTFILYNGIFLLILFSFRFSANESNIMKIYVGLWQRMMLLNNYVYLVTIALILLNRTRQLPEKAAVVH
jgi:hypothetical protein